VLLKEKDVFCKGVTILRTGFIKMTEMAHLYAAQVLEAGDTAVDATAGNGKDTLFLARQVGPCGRVYAFDIQEQSLISTAALLEQANLRQRVSLLKAGHEQISAYIHEPVAVAMFNLGYLPGGDHRIVTGTKTTLPAVQAAMGLLRKGGLITVVVYPGHPEGKEEQEALLRCLSGLNSREYGVVHVSLLNQENQPPALILICKR
jgi:predicted methyltransferase